MFDATLEYRKFLQRGRTEPERRSKLTELAERWLSRRDSIFPKSTPVEVVEREIVDSYNRGDDIPDPDFFTREDIALFAEENGISSDPMVKLKIRSSYVSH